MKKRMIFLGVLLAAVAGGYFTFSTAVKTDNHEHHDILAETCGRCGGSGWDKLTQNCRTCNGTKMREKAVQEDCSMCDRTGEVTSSTGTKSRCPRCQGLGYKVKTVMVSCDACNGTGGSPMPCMTCKGSGQV